MFIVLLISLKSYDLIEFFIKVVDDRMLIPWRHKTLVLVLKKIVLQSLTKKMQTSMKQFLHMCMCIYIKENIF